MTLFENQFQKGGLNLENTGFYSRLGDILSGKDTPAIPKTPDYTGRQSMAQPGKNAQTAKTPSQNSDNDESLIVVFDEAKILTQESDPGLDSPYQCIRRALKGSRIVGVFMDTSAKLAEFMPTASSSDRENSSVGNFLPPLFELNTFDVFKDHLFFRGRPLWRMQWKHRCNRNYNELIQFAANKLMFNSNDEDSLCSLFICRFGLQPEQEMAHSLVAKHMATLVSVSHDRKVVEIKYKSEPILAEASAYLTSKYTNNNINVTQVVEKVSEKLRTGILSYPKGNRGEVAGAALLGYVLDKIRSQDETYDAESKNLSRDVPVKEFLDNLCTASFPKEAQEKIEGWFVNFTNRIEWNRRMTPMTSTVDSPLVQVVRVGGYRKIPVKPPPRVKEDGNSRVEVPKGGYNKARKSIDSSNRYISTVWSFIHIHLSVGKFGTVSVLDNIRHSPIHR